MPPARWNQTHFYFIGGALTVLALVVSLHRHAQRELPGLARRADGRDRRLRLPGRRDDDLRGGQRPRRAGDRRAELAEEQEAAGGGGARGRGDRRPRDRCTGDEGAAAQVGTDEEAATDTGAVLMTEYAFTPTEHGARRTTRSPPERRRDRPQPRPSSMAPTSWPAPTTSIPAERRPEGRHRPGHLRDRSAPSRATRTSGWPASFTVE